MSGRGAGKTLILGGARSGKSRYAEQWGLAGGLPVTVIATAIAGDAEMAQRIASHRSTRPVGWTVIEEPYRLATALREADGPARTIIVDCLTLWVTQLLTQPDQGMRVAQIEELLRTLPTLAAEVLLISNETGLGVTPLGELTREFVDTIGRLHQDLARQSERVVFMIAGLPQFLKGSP